MLESKTDHLNCTEGLNVGSKIMLFLQQEWYKKHTRNVPFSKAELKKKFWTGSTYHLQTTVHVAIMSSILLV